MSNISYTAFSEDFVGMSKDIFHSLGFDVDVRVWNSGEVNKIYEDGIKVIMARGGTAIRVRECMDIPVVEIPIPFDDMMNALVKASYLGKNIGVIGYNNLMGGLEILNPLLNINIKQIFINNEEDMEREILNLKLDGIDVIVGGIHQTDIARELGMRYIRIDLSEKALEYAYREAKNILDSVADSNKKNEELRAILNHTKEGYICINKSGNLTLINNRALALISRQGKNPLGENINDVLPELKDLLNTLETGKEKTQEFMSFKDVNILYDMIPLKVNNDEIFGAMISFNDENTISQGEHKIRNKILNKGLYASYKFHNIKGESKAISNCINIAKEFSKTNSTVLIVGETGVGKELFAQSIHNNSARKNGPFIAVNCASLPESILESELFGYDEGAFTGAKRSGKAGHFELAHNGTIFLDEISEMPITLQGRLLRVLQERKVMRLGSDRVIPIDIRVIAATNKKLIDLVKENKFRADLFYRLNVLTLIIPSLSERREDIEGLVYEFLDTFYDNGKIHLTKEAMDELKRYRWPGNVRQLKNFIEKLTVINKSQIVDGDIIRYMLSHYEPLVESDDIVNGVIPQVQEKLDFKPSLTREEVIKALGDSRGNRNMASDILGVHRSTLWRLMKKYRVE